MSGDSADMERSGRSPERVLDCGLCGERFLEDRGQPTCRSCPLAEGCRFVRCPRCGYENPVSPAWIERLSSYWADSDGEQTL